MKVKETLTKEIIIEVIALVLFVVTCTYATITLSSKNTDSIKEQDGIVTILDEKNFKGLNILSDGKGISSNGVTYTITNNNSEPVSYELVVSTNVHNEEILKNIRVSLDDIYISDITSLERRKGGYVLGVKILNPGYTKVHSIKYWYKLDTKKEIANEKIDFSYKIELI